MTEWQQLATELERMLRLRTFPLAFKRLPKVEDLDAIPRVRRMGRHFTMCQMLGSARSLGPTIGATAGDMMPLCASVVGLREVPEEYRDGKQYVGRWVEIAEDAQVREQALTRVPCDGSEAVVAAPLAAEKFAPDIILIFAR